MATAGTTIYPPDQLHQQITAKGIPIVGVSGPPWDGITQPQPLTPWTVTYAEGATPEQISLGNQIASEFDGLARVYRNLFAIYTDITALTTLQKGRVWSNLGTGGDKLYYHDTGPNAPTIMTLDLLIGGAIAADESKLRLITIYVQDNPYYLDEPSFDPTIRVLGVE